MPAKTVAYQKHVAAHALEARGTIDGWPMDARYLVELTIYRAANRGDWDNYAKGLCDGMTGILWKDDRQIVFASVILHVNRLNPRAEIKVETSYGV